MNSHFFSKKIENLTLEIQLEISSQLANPVCRPVGSKEDRTNDRTREKYTGTFEWSRELVYIRVNKTEK